MVVPYSDFNLIRLTKYIVPTPSPSAFSYFGIFMLSDNACNSSPIQVIVNVLGFQKPLNESTSLPRLHHQLFPNYIRTETDFPEDADAILRSKGHRIIKEAPDSESGAVQCVLTDEDGKIYATSDGRKGGSPAGY